MERDAMRQRARDLDRAWDALLDDPTTAPPPHLDGVRARVLRALSRPIASPDLAAAQERVWRRLLRSQVRTTGKAGAMSTPLTLSPNGHGTFPAAPHHGATPAPRWGAWPQVVAAALLVLALAGGYLLPRAWQQTATPDPTQVLPAIITQEATPAATPAPAAHTWATYRGSPARLGVSADPGPGGSPLQLWRFATGERVNSEPAVVDGVIYAGSENGHVYAFDAATGEVRWDVDTGSPIDSSPAVAGGLLTIADADGNLLALDTADGAERWRVPGGRPEASPAMVNGVVYSGGADGTLSALDAATGEVVWQSALGALPSRSPAVGGGLVAIGAEDHALHVVDQTTGEERWRFPLADGTISTPVIAGDVIYVSAFDAAVPALYALDAATGQERWHVTPESQEAIWVPAVAGNTLYAGSDDGAIYALDAANGAIRWQFATGDRVPASGTVAGNVLFIASHDRNLYALDTASGRELWRFPLDEGVDKGPSIVDGVAYLGTNAGSIYAIGGTEAAGTAPEAPALGVPTPAPAADTAAQVQVAWESRGNPDSPLARPTDMELGPDGHLWVTDGANNRFQILDTDGSYLESWGGPGDGDGEFSFSLPNGDIYGGIEFAPDGSFYVLDSGNFRVQQFSADRTFVRAFGSEGTGAGQFTTRPVGLALGPEGTVLVLEPGRSVHEFRADGAFLRAVPLAEGGGNDMAINGAGELFVSSEDENDSVRVYAMDGSVQRRVGEGVFREQPLAIAFDAGGRVFVTSGSSIFLFAPDGAFIGTWGKTGRDAGEITEPGGIVVDGATVYNADYGSGRIQAFTLLPPLAP